MTGPVNTDALRDAAWEKYAALNGIHPHSIERDTFEQGWDAAANEVDRLRAKVARRDTKLGDYAVELDRLRAVIENAPHDQSGADGCMSLVGGKCDCWKADAL